MKSVKPWIKALDLNSLIFWSHYSFEVCLQVRPKQKNLRLRFHCLRSCSWHFLSLKNCCLNSSLNCHFANLMVLTSCVANCDDYRSPWHGNVSTFQHIWKITAWCVFIEVRTRLTKSERRPPLLQLRRPAMIMVKTTSCGRADVHSSRSSPANVNLCWAYVRTSPLVDGLSLKSKRTKNRYLSNYICGGN